jgi:hypothetical protein
MSTTSTCLWDGLGGEPTPATMTVTGTSEAICPAHYSGRSALASAGAGSIHAYTDHDPARPEFVASASAQNVYDITFFESGSGQSTLVLTLQNSWNVFDDLGAAGWTITIQENGTTVLYDGLDRPTNPPISASVRTLTARIPYSLGTTAVFSVTQQAFAQNGGDASAVAAFSVQDAATVPEPSTSRLAVFGLVAVGLGAWRTRRRAGVLRRA